LRDGHRIAEASGARLALSPAGLHDDLAALQAVVGDGAWECLLAGGEEHSLLATFPRGVPDGWRTIGVVEAGEGILLDGVVQQPRGWDHFRA
jgi:thiamine-monophosphate kinase